jgi:DNA-binding Lrp family transcriptional regulator
LTDQKSQKVILAPEARMILAIRDIGPRNMSKISSITGIPVETVRYKLKRQLVKMGFYIRAQPSYGKLGLSPYWATIKFVKSDVQLPAKIFKILGERGYLVHCSRELPTGQYSANFAIPSGTISECTSNLDYLVRSKVLADYQLEEVTYAQYHSVNPEYFNFRSKRWEVDWNKVRAEEPPQFKMRGTQITSFDKYDLILLKELENDALQHTTNIARKIKAATPVLGYHYRTHLQKYGLVETYVVGWTQEVKTRQNQVATITRIRISDVKQKELQQVHNTFVKLPFSWSEHMTSRNNFIATLSLPTEYMLDTLDYLNSELPTFADKIECSFIRKQDTAQFTIPDNMYERNWNISYGELGPEIKKLVRG